MIDLLIDCPREWVAQRAGKTSVPQIFFNSRHVGGNEELNHAFSDPELKQELLLLLEEDYVGQNKEKFVLRQAPNISLAETQESAGMQRYFHFL